MKNKMKILLTALLVMSLNSYAKSQSGIYMNLTDYRNNKLTYEIGCTSGEKIHIHDFFWNMATIKVVDDGKKYTLKKGELYGFRDCNNDVYRFYNNMEYLIAEAGNIYIYLRKENTAQNKNNKVVNVYYFSGTPDGEILPLTLGNLKKVYKSNDKFTDLLDKFFNAGDVSAYDEVHNTYKVNYVFSKTINNNN